MTEDKPDQPDFAAIVKKPAFKLDCRDTDRTVISIDTAEQLLEDLWKDYVLAVKEENKQLREASLKGQWVKATDRLPQHMIYQYIRFGDQKYTAYYDYSLKKFMLNVGHQGFEPRLIEWLDEQAESELSKKGEPVNSELLNALKEMLAIYKKYANDNPEEDHYADHAKDLIERAESTPLPIQKVNEENERSGGWFERSKADFEKMQSESTPLEPVKSLQERILCAAIWYKHLPLQRDYQKSAVNCNEGIVLTGYRHGNVIRTMAALTGLRTVDFGADSVGDHEQGFLTNLNRFVDRKEAYKIAFEADQIIGPNKGHAENEIGLTSEDLYSEDLY
jgi:hypothetical protein